MKRERWLRWYGYQFKGHLHLLPSISVSWDPGYRSVEVRWLLWGCEVQASIGWDE